MKLPHSVCEVMRDHVVLESECIDRMYLKLGIADPMKTGVLQASMLWPVRTSRLPADGQCCSLGLDAATMAVWPIASPGGKCRRIKRYVINERAPGPSIPRAPAAAPTSRR